MKRWSNYDHHAPTLTVGELRAMLAAMPEDAPVVLTYEGVENGFGPDDVVLVTQADIDSGGKFYCLPGCVVIDAERL
jgi:hypothetical protein